MDTNSVEYKEKLVELRKIYTMKEISEILGISERTLSRHMKEFGLTKSSNRTDILDDDVLQFWNDGFTIVEIANYYSCSHETITKRLAKYGIACDRPAGIRKHFARVRSGIDDIGTGMVVEDDGSTARKHVDGGRRDKLGLAGFVERARAVHGDVYDYSKVEYKNTKTKVCIVCQEHGGFMQTPEKHMSGQGCPLCANDKLEATNMRRYGSRRPLQTDEILQKAVQRGASKIDHAEKARKNTCLERYGVEHFTRIPEVVEKRRVTLQARYGGNSPFSSPEIQAKAQKTVFEKYGVKCSFQDENVKQKCRVTCFNKYGVEYPMQSFEIRQKVIETKRKNHSFNKSDTEDLMYDFLCNIFGKDDVERQYSSDVYSWACDFYIKSRDMYIEFNGTWTHNDHWFDSDSESDINVLELWLSKIPDHPYYRSAVYAWADLDVRKRARAEQNGLNYVVFWDNNFSDFYEWVEDGCPDRQDWAVSFRKDSVA